MRDFCQNALSQCLFAFRFKFFAWPFFPLCKNKKDPKPWIEFEKFFLSPHCWRLVSSVTRTDCILMLSPAFARLCDYGVSHSLVPFLSSPFPLPLPCESSLVFPSYFPSKTFLNISFSGIPRCRSHFCSTRIQ